MQIGVYGSGYLATVIASCVADFGLPVTCCDQDAESISAFASGHLPYFEKNLLEVVRRNVRCGRLIFSSNIDSITARCKVIFLAQDTQDQIEDIALELASQNETQGSILVISTPVAVGTGRRIEKKIKERNLKAHVVSHPLFLTDGCAVEDFNWPDRIVLGTESGPAVLEIKQIYRRLVMRGVPTIVTNHETAELVREAATAFLATKVSFINEVANLCEHVQADAVDLALALGLDKKIAPRCMQPGAGLGGLFVKNDMEALASLAADAGVQLKVLSAARQVNNALCERILGKLSQILTSVQNKKVGVLGLSFKPNTQSVASSPSLLLIRQLVASGAAVHAYDPAAIPAAKRELNGLVQYCENAYAAARGVDALVLSTAWPEFRTLDFDRIRKEVRQPVIVDTKNMLDSVRMRSLGFHYVGMGRA